MKKIILTLSLLLLVITACSKKDDDNNGNLAITKNNVYGNWTFSEIIRPDGTIVPYPHQCSTQNDYIFFDFIDIYMYRFKTNCENYETYRCDNYFLLENQITGCNYVFDGTITEFTSQRMRIEYDEVIPSNNFINPIGDVKGFIFIKQ
ncbi:hypothetical protein FLGE108171_01190 [Flavobacterium gelidilacus]|uniref:hypothetical protein n=1 Tax=Flavobacterium gelidilacus TaxID=206041 RepID=UPI0004235636|nr:hypothetical protein [Flavobacterium gelidilacus]